MSAVFRFEPENNSNRTDTTQDILQLSLLQQDINYMDIYYLN